MLNRLLQAVEEKNQEKLRNSLASLYGQSTEIDKSLYPIIERLLFENWHHEHEDIVGMIWLDDLKDNRFIDPIMAIAQQPEVYRPFDDELESTLRKCVHALKTIGTNES